MSSIGERIKIIRKKANLTQQKFADSIGVKQNTIATYEMDRSIPIDPIITSICKQYMVNEAWLRTGEGDPFMELSRDAQLSRFIGEILQGEDSADQRRFLNALMGASPAELHAIAQFAQRLAAEYEQEKSGE